MIGENMRIVIIGDGRVAHKIAVQLAEEDYDIVLIDQDEGHLKASLDELDIFCITGNGADPAVQKQADVPKADLVIACTSSDEVNMLNCLLAKKLGAKHTVARVRNPVYYNQLDLLREDLHLSMVVNPDLTTSNAIARVVLFPGANKIETFMKGRVELVESQVRDISPLVGMSLADIYRRYRIKVLVCAAKRGNEVIIPDGNFLVQAGDRLYLAAEHKQIKEFFTAVGQKPAKIKNVMICGGGRVGFYLTQRLLQAGKQVKIIEKNPKRCEELCEAFPKATIIQGDSTDHEILLEEGIQEADAFVAVTNMDEENIIMCLFAKMQGVGKIVSKVNEDSRAQMVEGIGIDSIVSTKGATAETIMNYVRARMNSYSIADVETIYQLLSGKVEALEFLIKKEGDFINVPLKDLRIKKDYLIACIGRNGKIIIPNGGDYLQVGDSVVVVTKNRGLDHFEDILA